MVTYKYLKLCISAVQEQMLLSNPNPWSVDYPECLDRDTVVKLTHFQSCDSN